MAEAHPAVGWTYQIGMEIGIGLLYIIAIVADGVTDTTDVVVGMVANAMALADHSLVELRVFAHIVAHHEEGGLDMSST